MQIFLFFLGLIPGLRTLADRLPFFVLTRTAKEFKPAKSVINSRIGYAYYQRHLQIVLEFLRIRSLLLSVPMESFPKQPVLFMYGTEKSLNFYSDDMLSSIQKRTDRSTSKSFKSVHWIMNTHEKEFTDTLTNWISKT
eukprot:IDg4612t1